jgi:hypothetical protein
MAADGLPGMVWIPGGEFMMGTDDAPGRPDERPAHRVRVSGFWMDETDVINAQFQTVVEATGYVTTAEKPVDAAEILRQSPPGTPPPPPEKLVPGSLVFRPTPGPVKDRRDVTQWWHWTPGASWRHSEGPGSSLDGREDHHSEGPGNAAGPRRAASAARAPAGFLNPRAAGPDRRRTLDPRPQTVRSDTDKRVVNERRKKVAVARPQGFRLPHGAALLAQYDADRELWVGVLEVAGLDAIHGEAPTVLRLIDALGQQANRLLTANTGQAGAAGG